MGEYSKAIKHFEKMSAIQPNQASLFYHLGYAYYMAHDIENAKKALRKAIDLNPADQRSKALYSRLTETSEI